ncbi:MAG: hypothetical protein FWG72_08835 [Oscillospiraceae bacterium]|nr:hypothetical protein [Oscillospiraceae bacterium]
MLNKGHMYIGDTAYTLHELKTGNFYRFDIVKNGAEFHMDVDSILFSYYKTKRRKSYGDAALYQKYIDTVTHAKKMHGNKVSASKWKGGRFVHTVQKGIAGCRFVTQTHNGKWFCELYEHNDIVIVMRLSYENYKIAMIPSNDREYEYQKEPKPSIDEIDAITGDADIAEVKMIGDALLPKGLLYGENLLNVFSDKLLVVLPRISPHTNRNLRLANAYVNLVGFFQKRHGIETHVISSAESYVVVPKLKDVKTVLAVHPADVAFVNQKVMPLDEDAQDILHQDAFTAATDKAPLIRNQSIEERFVDVTAREKTAVNYIAQKYYDIVVDFENPWNSAYKLKPTVATIYLRVSAHNMTVKGYINGEPLGDLCALLMYDGACKPLGSWKEEPE